METNIISETPQNKCWAELIGYPCCPSFYKTVFGHDEYGDWGYDFKHNQWCGITPFTTPIDFDKECWSEVLGYTCCKGCAVYEIDGNGQWGYENGQWCGIPSYCSI